MLGAAILWVGLATVGAGDYLRPFAAKAFDQATLDAEGFGDKKALKREDDGLRVTLAPGEPEAGWKTPQMLRLGGDCTITVGVIAGLLRRQPDLGLIYFDGDADLTTPDTTRSGIFDSMGMAHMIGEGDPELAHLGPRFPLLPQDRIALFGFQPYEIEPEEARLLEKSAMLQYPVTSMDARPAEFAAEARGRLEERAAAIAVHFDVDVMDSAEIPLANWPHYDALSFGDAMRCLRVFVASPKLAALVITEINPDHDPEGLLVRQFIDAFADAMLPVAANAARFMH